MSETLFLACFKCSENRIKINFNDMVKYGGNFEIKSIFLERNIFLA